MTTIEAVAIQGVKGSYTEEAARKLFGEKIEIAEYFTFEDALRSVALRETKYAVVPLKNKIVGEIRSATDALRRTDLKISGEIRLDIRHVLAGTQNAEFENLQTVRSHAEALKQCRNFLSRYKHLQTISGADTASEIKRIAAENLPENAAIGSRRAAEMYGAKILRENIADAPGNWTAFYVLEI